MEKMKKRDEKKLSMVDRKKVLYIYTVKIHIIIIIIIILYILSRFNLFNSILNYSINCYFWLLFEHFFRLSPVFYCQSRSVNVDLSMYALVSLVNLDLSKFVKFVKKSQEWKN